MSALRPNTKRRRASFWALALSALGFGSWWVLSIVFHVALLGGIYVAVPPTPVTSADSSELSMRISPDRVREIVEEIRQDEMQRFKDKVADLLKIKQELDQLNADKIAQYNQVIQEEAPRAREKLPDAFTRVIAAQKEALAAQDTAEKALADFAVAQKKISASANPEDVGAAAAEADAALKNALTAQGNAATAQHQAALAQEEVSTQLRLANVSAETLDAHLAAENAQALASTAQGSTTGIINQLANARRSLPGAEQAAEKQQAALQAAKEKVEATQAVLATREEAVESARQRVTDARAASTESANADKTAKTDKAEKKRLAELAKAAAEKLKKEQAALTRADQQMRAAQSALKRLNDAVAKQQPRTDEALTALQKRRESVEQMTATVEGSSGEQQQTSTTAQRTSLSLQEAVNATVTKALADAKPETPPPPVAGVQPTVLPTVDLEHATTLAELFKQAQAAEIAVAETFKNVRAAELASIRKIPLSEALAMTKVATPERPVLNTQILTQDIASVAEVREQEKTIGAAVDQMDSMVALAERMHELAVASGANLSVAEIQAQSDRNERMEALALEDAGATAKDLSAEMAAAHGEGQGQGASTEGTSQEPAEAPAESPGEQPGALAGGTGQGTPGGAGPAASIMGIPVKDYRPLHGRTVRQGMVSIEEGRNPAWLYVDTWHLIGPWPNPGRKNLDTKFPPETVVNLDAIYQGGRKNEIPMPIRWEFFQMPSQVGGKERTPVVPMIRPPGLGDYEIYYAFTELWFDEAADLWVAIGSDDQSKVWINDLLIWKSGDAHKTWRPNEGLRKVHFKKGINRVLYRLENGQNSGGFSFVVCLAKDPAAAR